MGCNFSQQISPMEEQTAEESRQIEWKQLPSTEEARKKFELEGSLPKNAEPGLVELRQMLDDPLAQPVIYKYATEVVRAQDIFLCWMDLLEFRRIPTIDFRRTKALHIYHKYIKADAVLVVGDISVEAREKIKADLELSKEDPSIVTSAFYEAIQTRCFNGIYHNVYLPFKQTNEYYELYKNITNRYNSVRLNDFEYFHKLGEGGFGFVVHCRKKSTGRHYAMKIQTKKGLLDCFADEPSRVDYEKQAFATCQHPFIVNLDYAFQTDSLAIMVLGLATAGDLQRALAKSAEEKLDENRVRFYVAEIVLALAYLHQMGLMYRDLKPNNVLLHEDGHIQLVDLGGVTDEKGMTLGRADASNNGMPLFAQSFAKNNYNLGEKEEEDEKQAEGKEKRPKRKLSIMGTFGYMAPEMVIMLNQSSYEKTGYNNTVDWWSLGVTMFKLLTGSRPFTDDNFNTFVEMATTMNALVREHCDSPEYAILFQEIPFPAYISKDAKDLISKLLDVDPRTRLGSGPNGVKNIKAHPFFRSIEWNKLEQKHIEPPFRPDHPRFLDDPAPYPDFETIMKDYGKGEWLTDAPAKELQKYFANWNFTSANTIRIESGLAHVMDQFDTNFKVRQLMGMDAKGMTNFNTQISSKPLTSNSSVNVVSRR